MRRLFTILLIASTLPLASCQIIGLTSVMAESFESQKLIEVPAKYPGLEGKTVAVLVDTSLSMLYEHPGLQETVTRQVSLAIQAKVKGAQVLNPDALLSWQFSQPYWSAMPYGELAETLGVDRIVYIDLQEYRLNPVGNSSIWDGTATAEVGIVEREGLDPDGFAERFPVRASFPDQQGVGRESATAPQIEQGLMTVFLRKIAFLFYLHTEPKHPDKYQPGMDDGNWTNTNEGYSVDAGSGPRSEMPVDGMGA